MRVKIYIYIINTFWWKIFGMVNLKTIPLSRVSFLFYLFIIQFLTIPQKSEHLYNKFETIIQN